MFDGASQFTVFVFALAAAIPPYLLLRKTSRGRARSAIGFLLGLSVGLGGAVLLANEEAALLGPALLGTFIGPFVGMTRAKWELFLTPKRKSAHRTSVRA